MLMAQDLGHSLALRHLPLRHRRCPLCALTLCTYSDPREDVWAFLNTIPDLQNVAIWCMNGPLCAAAVCSARLGTSARKHAH